MIYLPIKRNWYDMILNGIKKEEYRNVVPYYISRLEKYLNADPIRVKFVNGYSKNSPSFIATVTIDKGTGRIEWGAEPNVLYYVLSILSIEK